MIKNSGTQLSPTQKREERTQLWNRHEEGEKKEKQGEIEVKIHSPASSLWK